MLLPNNNKIAIQQETESSFDRLDYAMEHKDFTLTELMIMVAIIPILAAIGFLAAIGIPQYQNYLARLQAAEGLSLASGIKTSLTEFHVTNGQFPSGTNDAHGAVGIAAAEGITGKYVTSVEISDDGEGTITAKFGSGDHADKFLQLKPTVEGGTISFACTSDLKEHFRPKGCEEGTLTAAKLTWASGAGNACWDQAFATENEGNGWVVGAIGDDSELAVAVANRSAAKGHRPAAALGELAWHIGLRRVRCQ